MTTQLHALDIASMILKENNKPMHVNKIATNALKKGFLGYYYNCSLYFCFYILIKIKFYQHLILLSKFWMSPTSTSNLLRSRPRLKSLVTRYFYT